jgi:hypothetical protein
LYIGIQIIPDRFGQTITFLTLWQVLDNLFNRFKLGTLYLRVIQYALNILLSVVFGHNERCEGMVGTFLSIAQRTPG